MGLNGAVPCPWLGRGCGHKSGMERCCSGSGLEKGGGPAFVLGDGSAPASTLQV